MDFASEMNRLAVRMHAEFSLHTEEGEESEARLTLKLEDHRSQQVQVTLEQHDDHDYLRLVTTVGDASSFSPERLRHLLGLNASLVRGAFALSEGRLILTDALDAHPLEPERAARAILQLGRTADQMERALFGTDRA